MKTSFLLPFFVGAVGCSAVVLAGCSKTSGRTASPRGGAIPAVPVQLAVSAAEDIPRTIESIGAVQALRTVEVRSRVDGVIARVDFAEGDEVKVGDPLVTLDRAPFENNLRMARADLANAKAEAATAEEDARRYEELGKQQAISREQLAQLTTKAQTTLALVQAREAGVANAELQLGYTEISAPISGRTGQLHLHEGALVKANDTTQAIVTINQLAPIHVAFSVPEPELTRLRAAFQSGSASVTVTDRSGAATYQDGRLTFIDNAVDPATGTITLKAEFPNADHALWPGEFVFVHTVTGVDRSAIVVPASAIMTGQQGSSVFAVKDDQTVELRAITVGRTVGDRALIAEGLKAGETVVADGQLRLVPGSRVVSKSLDAPGSAASPSDDRKSQPGQP